MTVNILPLSHHWTLGLLLNSLLFLERINYNLLSGPILSCLVTSGQNSFVEDTISVMSFRVGSNVYQTMLENVSVQVFLKMNALHSWKRP
jgi:hypothetical protein